MAEADKTSHPAKQRHGGVSTVREVDEKAAMEREVREKLPKDQKAHQGGY